MHRWCENEKSARTARNYGIESSATIFNCGCYDLTSTLILTILWHLSFGSWVIHTASVTRKSCFLRFCETLRIDMASKRLMNESTLDSTHARSGSISLFPGFRLFFRLPTYFVMRRQLYTVSRGRGKGNFCREIDPMVFVSQNIEILELYVDPIWSKIKEQLWFTIAQIFVRAMYW